MFFVVVGGFFLLLFLVSHAPLGHSVHNFFVFRFSITVTTDIDCTASPTVPPTFAYLLSIFLSLLKSEIAPTFSNFNNSYGSLLLSAKEPLEKL